MGRQTMTPDAMKDSRPQTFGQNSGREITSQAETHLPRTLTPRR